MDQVWVLWWRYGDGSSAGVLRAYDDHQRANEDMDLLNDGTTSKEYKLEEVPVYHRSIELTESK